MAAALGNAIGFAVLAPHARDANDEVADLGH
jgi:hypothetical protein